jgi:hypothetical protein
MNRWMFRAFSRQFRLGVTGLVCVLTIMVPMLWPFSSVFAQSEGVGFRDFRFPSGTGGNSEPTGEKPESKLWWNDDLWFASMWSEAGNAYHIYRLDLASQKWIDTGTPIDDRSASRADALWDGTKLYIVSHIFVSSSGQPAPAGERGELYRYSYQPASKSYLLDAGFPVEVTRGKSETLVLEKDSTGQLWVTYIENRKVMVNHSLNGNDHLWGTPYVLPAGGAENVASDDISSIIAYNQHVGIMWSNQTGSKTMYFAVHPVGSSDSAWTRVRAYSISGDDHINLKVLQTDDAGNIFAVVKTSKAGQLIMVLGCKRNTNRCQTEADWDAYPVYDSSTYDPTRPILLIDEDNRHLYVFTRNQVDNANSGIFYKRADLDNINFPDGIGTAFIRNSMDTDVNDPTSTKQNLGARTGLVVLASDTRTKYYLHNYMSLNASSASPTIHSFTPAIGTAGSFVTLTGSEFNKVTSVAFNGTPATNFVIDSNTQIRAQVPSGAISGPLSVASPAGISISIGTFTVNTLSIPQPYHYLLPLIIRGDSSGP